MDCNELDTCPKFQELVAKVNKLSESADRDINEIRSDMLMLRADVHHISAAVKGIHVSLDKIASNMEKLTDLPETWQAIKGWWKVMEWLKTNAFLLLFIAALIAYVLKGSIL